MGWEWAELEEGGGVLWVCRLSKTEKKGKQKKK